MNKLISIGELLIDFTGTSVGTLVTVPTFQKNPGGAPANVAVCVSRLGGKSEFITKLGTDCFGDYLLNVLNENGVGTRGIMRTDRATTPLAFVTLDSSGEREFAFYRNPSSDLFLEADEIIEDMFNKGDILHFCSVDLVDYPVKDAHRRAIQYALNAGVVISFDPNLRYGLWKNRNELIETVKRFIPYAHILKVSEDELLDITSLSNQDDAVKMLFCGNVKTIIVTRASNGASIFTPKFRCDVSGFSVLQIDTTGAGDAFIGAFLSQILANGFYNTTEQQLSDYIRFANAAAALCVTKQGAIPAMPTIKEVEDFLKCV